MTGIDGAISSTIADESPVAITRIDRNGSIVYANRRAEELFGIPREAILARQVDDPLWCINSYDGTPLPPSELPFTVALTTGRPVYGARHTICRGDGSLRYLRINAVPIYDTNRSVTAVVAVIEDMTEDHRLRTAIESQRDMLIALDSVSTPEEAAEIVLNGAMRIPPLECGAIFLREQRDDADVLRLVVHDNLPETVTLRLQEIPVASSLVTAIQRDQRPRYGAFLDLLGSEALRALEGESILERIHAAALVPIYREGKLLGTLNLGSCREETIPPVVQSFLESVSSWLGDVIGKRIYQEELRRTEQLVREQAEELKEANIALKMILKTQREEQEERFAAVQTQIDRRLRPILRRIREHRTDVLDGGLVDVLEVSLDSIVSALSGDAKYHGVLSVLSARESDVALLVRDDYSTKEIAQRLSISTDAVAFHRKQIRRKLGLTGTKTNLRSFLQTL